MHSAANNPAIDINLLTLLATAGTDATKIDVYGCNVLMMYLLVA